MHLGLPGLVFEDGYRRYYPSGRIVAHAVGQVDLDEHGVSGLELGLEQRVRGSADGKPIQLSLDMRVQYVLEHEMAEAARAFSAKATAGIVLNVRTGEVIALGSLPDYEPNLRRLDAGDSTRNRMTQDVYELGSIFKIFAFTEAVEDKVVRLDEMIPIGKAEVLPAQARSARSLEGGTSGSRLAALSQTLGRSRDGDHRLRPRHLGQSVEFCRRRGIGCEWRNHDPADFPQK